MKTDAELVDLAKRVAGFEIAFDMAGPLDELTNEEKRRVIAFVVYELQYRRSPKNQKVAMRLFKSWLTPAQLGELRRREFVTVVGSNGGIYRLRPHNGMAERVEQHGRNWYRVATYCYHDEADELPSADNSLAHLFILSTDESRFLAEANETKWWPQCWDSEYMQRRAAIRRAADVEAAA